jgi:hypothetical protein
MLIHIDTVNRHTEINGACKAPLSEANNRIFHCITQMYSTPPLFSPKHIYNNLMSVVLRPVCNVQ